MEPVVISEKPDRADVDELVRELVAHNVAATGHDNAKEVTAFIRDDGRLIGGIYGWTWGGACEIDYLWVHAEHRGRGLGSALLAAAEETAKERGCGQMVLTTFTFQAPQFYERHGFEVKGRYEDQPRGHTNFFLRKTL